MNETGRRDLQMGLISGVFAQCAAQFANWLVGRTISAPLTCPESVVILFIFQH